MRQPQLGVAFIACFSFAMGLLMSPAIRISEYGSVRESPDEAPFGTLPRDQYEVVLKAEQNLVRADAGRIQRMVQVEAMILQAYIDRLDIARTLNCSVDTVRRDILTLGEMGSDAEYTPKRGWRATKAIFVINMALEPQDDEVYIDADHTIPEPSADP